MLYPFATEASVANATITSVLLNEICFRTAQMKASGQAVQIHYSTVLKLKICRVVAEISRDTSIEVPPKSGPDAHFSVF